MNQVGNIERAIIDDDSLNLLVTAFKLYEISKLDKNVYRKDEDLVIIRNLLTLYYKLIRPNYNDMIYNFRRKYVSNELLVEKNDTPEERKGLNLIYDYIQDFDIDNDQFNIFVTSLQLHSLLYKPIDEKNALLVEKKREEAKKLFEEGKRERNINKVREAQQILKSLEAVTFGGHLRTSSVVMNDFGTDIPDASEAKALFNQFLLPDKKEEFEKVLNGSDIFSYIDYAVSTTCYLIGLQPFVDGNKRVFRSLLNLMFKKKNLPPVFITSKERKMYHAALEKALITHDYSEMCGFYYYKICDSIYELDFKPYLESLGIDNIDDRKSTVGK